MSTDNGGTSAEKALDPLHVSAVNIKLARESHKTIKSITLYKNDNELRKTEKLKIRPSGSHQEKFNPTLDTRDHIRALVRCSSRWGWPINVDIDVDLRKDEQDGVYRKNDRKIEVVISAQQTQRQSEPSMPASITEIIEAYRQFRLLVIGNSGVGKSTLIHKIFGVKDVETSTNIRGEADIDREFISPTNDRFIVHDSLGFEGGDEGHMKIVKEFVAKRKGMSQIRDQLHAIWLCLDIPYAGGRLLETGVENLLQRRKEVFGDIPLVVVLTKVDLLDGQLETELSNNGTLEHYRLQYMEEHCIKSLRNAAGPDITHIAVSTKGEDYADSLRELLEATVNKMTKYHVNEGPSTMAVVAQRISNKEKIELSIRMGKKKYWPTLISNAVLGGRTMKECLQVIHKEIIAIWNFNDPNKYLIDDEFIEILYTHILAGLTESSTTPSTNTSGIFSELKDLFTADEGVHIVTRPMVRLVTAIPNRLYRVYGEAKEDAKILTAYIVDLICIMQIIFLLVPGDGVTRKTIAFALMACENTRKSVHQRIATLDENMGMHLAGSDYVLEKVEEILRAHNIEDAEINELRHNIPRVELQDSASGSS